MSPEKANSVLWMRRLPGRLHAMQALELLNFGQYDLAPLLKKRLLVPLGRPRPNAAKFFARDEIEQLCGDRAWLDKATKAVSDYHAGRNDRQIAARAAVEEGRGAES